MTSCSRFFISVSTVKSEQESSTAMETSDEPTIVVKKESFDDQSTAKKGPFTAMETSDGPISTGGRFTAMESDQPKTAMETSVGPESTDSPIVLLPYQRKAAAVAAARKAAAIAAQKDGKKDSASRRYNNARTREQIDWMTMMMISLSRHRCHHPFIILLLSVKSPSI